MALQTSPPSARPVRLNDLTCCHEMIVTLCANIVVTIVTAIAVEARAIRRDRATAQITISEDGKQDITVWAEMWEWREGDLGWVCRVVCGAGQSVDVRNGLKGVQAVSTLLHTSVAESPRAIQAVGTIPVALVGEGKAGITEGTFVRAGVIRPRHRRCEGISFGSWVPSCAENMRTFILGRPAFWWCQAVPALVGHNAESIPMVAPSPGAVAGQTEIVFAIAARRTVVVEFVMDVCSITT